MTERIVILGNGGTAIHAARAARASGYEGEIHMVSDADTPVFNPMLSPYYLKGTIQWDRCFSFDQTVYVANNITCHFGSPIESLDPLRQEIAFAEGTKLVYDKCLVATGASAVLPPIPGLRDSDRAFSLRTAQSVKDLERAISPAKKVIVLGASLVGLKVAEVLAKKSVKVTLLDIADQLLPQGAHRSSALFLRKYFEEHGVDVRLGCTLTGMDTLAGTRDTPKGVCCHFPDDIMEEADLVAVCTGVRPNVSFIRPGTVDIRQAIVVDEHLRTNCENLYAAGDVSQGYNILSGKQNWLGTWGNACRQGYVAGCNMAGNKITHPGSVSQNISPFFDWTYAQLGDIHTNGSDAQYVGFGEPSRGGYVLLSFDENQLKGANLLNCTYLAGRLKTVMLRKHDWVQYLADPEQYLTFQGLERVLNDMERASFSHSVDAGGR